MSIIRRKLQTDCILASPPSQFLTNTDQKQACITNHRSGSISAGLPIAIVGRHDSIRIVPLTVLHASVVVNDIHYHSELETKPVKFIELSNTTEDIIDLSEWSISEGIDHVFPCGSRLPAQGFSLLALNPTGHNRKFGSIFVGST